MSSGSVIVEATQVFAAAVTIGFFGLWTTSAGGAWAVLGWIFLMLMGFGAAGALIQRPFRQPIRFHATPARWWPTVSFLRRTCAPGTSNITGSIRKDR